MRGTIEERKSNWEKNRGGTIFRILLPLGAACLAFYWQLPPFYAKKGIKDWESYEKTDILIATISGVVTLIAVVALFRHAAKTFHLGRIQVLWVEDNPTIAKLERQIFSQDRLIKVTVLDEQTRTWFTLWSRRKLLKLDSEVKTTALHQPLPQAQRNTPAEAEKKDHRPQWRRELEYQMQHRYQTKWWVFRLWKWTMRRKRHYHAYIIDLSLAAGKNHIEWESGIEAIRYIREFHGRHEKEFRQKPVFIIYTQFFSRDPYTRQHHPCSNHLRYFLESALEIKSYQIVPKTRDLTKDMRRISERIHALVQ